ncbi:hypothetical protein [Streptomyces sp. NPDC087300]|uniref:hypothetical protein n=1 Tax=Streptomyces sp. NPDC087300 TaxID=3365780 RepID=UPI003802208E
MSDLDGLLDDPEFMRMVNARKELERADAAVVAMAADVADLSVCGTADLAPAIDALDKVKYVDEEEAAARRVSEAFTLTPATALTSGGGPLLALTGAVGMMRAALMELNKAVVANTVVTMVPNERGGDGKTRMYTGPLGDAVRSAQDALDVAEDKAQERHPNDSRAALAFRSGYVEQALRRLIDTVEAHLDAEIEQETER